MEGPELEWASSRGFTQPEMEATQAGKTARLPEELLYEFTFQEMKMITSNFSPINLPGEDLFGSTYKGFIDDNLRPGLKPQHVAVKVISSEGSDNYKDEWVIRVRVQGSLSHSHVLKLIGYCCEDVHRILVYEWMPHGSLENQLLKMTLPWSTRTNIALDVAKGLEFLHLVEVQCIDMDLKPSNILLDSDYTAKLSIFGRANTDLREYNSVHTRVMGTYGYVAPEYIATGHLYAKSNVYSFGVVLLELLTGWKAFDMSRPQMLQNLVEDARPMLKDARKLARIMDLRLGGQYSRAGAGKMADLAYKCLSYHPKDRPTMSSVVKILERFIKKEDYIKSVGNKVKKNKSHHNQGLASSLETPMPRAHYEVVLSYSDDQSIIIKPFIRKMLDVGINVFRNVGKVHQVGNLIDDDIYQAMESSKICIPILSNQYLSNGRCLHELACIREVQRDSDVIQILPIFYDMDPCEVYLQYPISMADCPDNSEMLTEIQLWQRTLEDIVD